MKGVIVTVCVVMLAVGCSASSQSAAGNGMEPSATPQGTPDDWTLLVVNESGTSFELWVGFLGFGARHRLGVVHTGATETYMIGYHENGLRLFLSDNAQQRNTTSNGVTASKGADLELTVDGMFRATLGGRQPGQ